MNCAKAHYSSYCRALQLQQPVDRCPMLTLTCVTVTVTMPWPQLWTGMCVSVTAYLLQGPLITENKSQHIAYQNTQNIRCFTSAFVEIVNNLAIACGLDKHSCYLKQQNSENETTFCSNGHRTWWLENI